MAQILNISFPPHNTFNARLYKAYNRQIMEIQVFAQTLPDGSGNVAEPYPPIIELKRRAVNDFSPVIDVLPNIRITHSKVEPYTLAFNQLYTFIINLEDVQINWFYNDAIFMNLGTESFTVGASEGFLYDIRLYDSADVVARPNPNNLLLPRTGFLGVYSLNSLNARFVFSNFQFLTPFVLNNVNRLALTTKPRKRSVCLQDSEYLTMCLLNFGGNAMKVDIFDNNGMLINRGIVDLATALGGSIDETTRAGVGPKNINNIAPPNWFVHPSFPIPPTIDANTNYYEITFGYYDPVNFNLTTSPSARPSATYRFYVKDGCCATRYRLHFVNQFGVDDVVSFENYEVIKYKSSDEFFERNLPNIFTTKDRERIQLIKEADEVITLVKSNMSKEEALWLKEINISPNILVEKNGVWYSYYVEAGEITVHDTEQTNYSIEILLISSWKDFSQIN